MFVNVTKDNVIVDKDSFETHQGEYNVTTCYFTFSEEFDSLVKIACFTINSTNETYKIDIVDNECSIPAEVLEKEFETITLGVYGYAVDQNDNLELRYSPTSFDFYVERGSYKEGGETPEIITPTQYELYSQRLQEGLDEIANLDIDAEKVEHTTTITITKKDGTTKVVEILDGEIRYLKQNTYNSVEEMKVDDTLKAGMYTQTVGYYEANDGGGATYKIRTKTNEDILDEQYIVALSDNNLVAELFYNTPLDVRKIGFKSDGSLISDTLRDGLLKEKSFVFKDGEYNFKKLVIDGFSEYNLFGKNATLSNNSCFDIKNSYNINIEKLNFNNNTNNVFIFRDCQNVKIESCNFTNSSTATIRLIRTSGKISKNYKIINNNFISVSKTNTWGGAIYVDGQGKNGSSDTTETLPIEQIEVRGNLFEEVGTGGVNFGGVKDAVIAENIFKNSYGSQNMLMTCTRETANLIISNNTFSGCGWECCVLNYCNNATISNNYFEDFGYGVTIENLSNNIIISNNVCNGMKDNRTHTGQDMQSSTYGILLRESSYINVVSNKIDDCSSNVVCGNDLSNITINENNLTNARNGISYSGSNGSNSDVNISNNIIDLCQKGITVGTHSNVKISNNIIKSTDFGIRPEQINTDSHIVINDNYIISDIGLDMSAIYNIDCRQTIINNKIIATTTPLKKYAFNVNIGYIVWNNPDVILNADNICNKYINNSFVNYDASDFSAIPTGGAVRVDYYLGPASNGTVFVMSDGIWKKKTGGGGSSVITVTNI